MSWVEDADAARHRAMWDDEQRQQRERDAAARTHAAAVAAKPWHQRGLGEINFGAPSVTEQARQQQQAEYDRHRRWVQYAAEKSGTVFRADGTPVEYDVTTPPGWFQ